MVAEWSRALQVGHPAHQEHRAAQADHLARVLLHPRPPARLPRPRHRPAQAHDDQGSGRGDWRAPLPSKTKEKMVLSFDILE